MAGSLIGVTVATGLAETFRAQAPAVFTVALGAAEGADAEVAGAEGAADAVAGAPAEAGDGSGAEEQAPTARTATIAVVTAIRRRLSMSFSSIVLSFS
ncbi:hypothetical protein GCM10010109_56460 [Actinoplanes campanulatus]|nr:hypothetical protein GCM10010109_56460 [Actinoplanes campanulatus]GID35042.1 hypothetical protein Aca09nite_15480 [Actinoplanes campanulatus]